MTNTDRLKDIKAKLDAGTPWEYRLSTAPDDLAWCVAEIDQLRERDADFQRAAAHSLNKIIDLDMTRQRLEARLEIDTEALAQRILHALTSGAIYDEEIVQVARILNDALGMRDEG